MAFQCKSCVRENTHLQLNPQHGNGGHSHREKNLPLVLLADGRASLLLIGWMFFAGIAIITALFYKEILSVKICDVQAWFYVHIGLMILAILLCIAGVVTIFVALKAWSKYATIHAIFGLIATGIGLLQVVFGFLRPDLKSTKRVFFNWSHGLSGFLGFISACVCVLLGFQIELIDRPLQIKGSIIVATLTAFYILWAVVLLVLKSCKPSKTKETAVEKNGVTVESPKQEKDLKHITIHRLLYIGGWLVVLTLIVLLLVYINLT